MNDGKPPLIKARKSKLNASSFSSNLYNNSNHTYSRAQEDAYLPKTTTNYSTNTRTNGNFESITLPNFEENLFGNFLSYSGSNADTQLAPSQNFITSEDLNIENQQPPQQLQTNKTKNSSFNINTSEPFLNGNTSKRPPITPRKHLTDNQNHLNDVKKEDLTKKPTKTNPFIVNNTKDASLASTRLVIESNLNQSFIDYDSSKVLRSVFNFEGRSVDLELDENVIKVKPTNGKLLYDYIVN